MDLDHYTSSRVYLRAHIDREEWATLLAFFGSTARALKALRIAFEVAVSNVAANVEKRSFALDSETRSVEQPPAPITVSEMLDYCDAAPLNREDGPYRAEP